jgi:hypothetical protein
MKQAVAPKKPLPELWQWMESEMESEIDPDLIVFTLKHGYHRMVLQLAGQPSGRQAALVLDALGE